MNPYNVLGYMLQVNKNNAEDTSSDVNVDYLSNGFKLRTVEGRINGANTYMYMAFAENPFKTANAR
jgi:hypothetical protein